MFDLHLTPDPSKAKTLILSNDAFFYLFKGEELIDEDNLEEVQEIEEYFPYGFTIEANWKYIGTDSVEAVFVPFVQDEAKQKTNSFDFDAEQIITKTYILRIKFSEDRRSIRLWTCNDITGERRYRGEFELKWNSAHKLVGFSIGDWRKGHGCLFWLKHFTELVPGALKPAQGLPTGL